MPASNAMIMTARMTSTRLNPASALARSRPAPARGRIGLPPAAPAVAALLRGDVGRVALAARHAVVAVGDDLEARARVLLVFVRVAPRIEKLPVGQLVGVENGRVAV